ncbi:MAG TPA: aspartyl/asparaginyl beta-hydroxylase domain-containing protein [Lysobacter sp.]|nr:aspartyl/asparaginyl beta-hydroxylase domain-containing protein [Lysobacter sp.]
MKLPVPFIQLPLLFDAAALAAEIDAIDEASWRPHPEGFAGNSMLPLVAVNGDPGNESFSGPMGTTEYLRRCPYLTQVLASLGATVGRSRLMRLAGQSEVSRHADQGYYWAERVRVHVPIVTQPTVRFECGGAAINMAAGECWIFDTWRQHRVLNDATASRIHLVADTIGGEGFWDLVGQGRPHNAPKSAPGWAPQQVVPAGGQAVEFATETVNMPIVMNPWELDSHFSLLFVDAVPHPNLNQVRVRTQRFLRTWRGLWFRYGDQPEGHDEFRQAMSAYLDEISVAARPLMLNNELNWFGAMRIMVASAAVRQPSSAAQSGAREYGDNG